MLTELSRKLGKPRIGLRFPETGERQMGSERAALGLESVTSCRRFEFTLEHQENLGRLVDTDP
jgi:hypothetical protein